MIHVEDLEFTYPGAASPAVRNVGFRIERGEIFGFLGPSGAGKSTTQKILIGLLRGYRGRISVMGRELSDWGADLYERVGVAFEFPNHYLKLTARENLDYFGSLYAGGKADPLATLERVGLADAADRRVAEFSKGMRGRMSVARALLHRPELLFLDEPTSGLDPVSSRRVREVIREERERGATVFLTTHDMHVADELCDRVAFIVDGEIRLIDAPRALRLRHGRRSVRVEAGSERLEFPLDGLADDPDFLAALRRPDLQTIHTQETTLEDIFVQVTGRVLS
jgi:fluoroquinolone transport system ATP-binding protein